MAHGEERTRSGAPDAVLARLIDGMDLHDGAASLIESWNSNDAPFGDDDGDMFQFIASSFTNRLSAEWPRTRAWEKLVKAAVDEARRIYEDSLAKSPPTHCKSF